MKKKKKPGFLFFFLVFLLYNVFTIPPMIFYGPFDEVRNMAIGAVATSRHPQYLKFFYSDEKVRMLMRQSGVQIEDNITGGSEAVPALTAKNDERIELIDIDNGRFKGKLLKIYNPRRVKMVTTKDLFKAGEKTSDIAKRIGAVAAINGGGFDDPNGKGNGGFPQGITVHEGQILTGKNITYPMDIIGLDKNGMLIIGKYTTTQLKDYGIREAVTFGPQIIKAGKRMVRGNGGWGIAPRTAIGQTREGTILMLIIDGRQISSMGATLRDVQEIMLDYGAINAANLDGGSSTTMYYKGKVINSPCSPFGERYVPTAFVVTAAKKEGL